MPTSNSVILSSANLARLGRLIVACHDGARAQTAAALILRGSRGDRLHEAAARRMSFADELTEMVRSFGCRPVQRGPSSFEGIRAAVHGVNAWIIGENFGDAYGSCARVETITEGLYERALGADMPRAARELVERHHAEIAADRAEFRRLSMGG